jgi:hypothetical protein
VSLKTNRCVSTVIHYVEPRNLCEKKFPIRQKPAFNRSVGRADHAPLHTSEGDFTDTEQTPRNLREVEAESVALLCCEGLGLEGADYARGYVQTWLYRGIGYDADAIPEKSGQKIFRAADQVLRAGRNRHQEQSH